MIQTNFSFSGLTTQNHALNTELRKTQQALTEQVKAFRNIEEKLARECGRAVQLESSNEQGRQAVERLEAKIWGMQREYENTPWKQQDLQLREQIKILEKEKADLATEVSDLKSPQSYFQERLDVEREVTGHFKKLLKEWANKADGKLVKSVDAEVQSRDEYIAVLERQNELMHKEMLSFRMMQEKNAQGNASGSL